MRPSCHSTIPTSAVPATTIQETDLLTHPTVDQLVNLGLAGMARAFAELQDNPTAAGLGHAEWLALLLDREATERSNRRLTARLRDLNPWVLALRRGLAAGAAHAAPLSRRQA
jgi:hypothetical protein